MRTWVMIAAVSALLGCGTPATMNDAGMVALDGGADAGSLDGATGADSAVGPGLEVDEYLSQFLDGMCSWFIECEPKLGLVALGQTLCHPLRAEQTRETFVGLVERGGVTFDASIAARCLEELEGAACNVAALDLARCDAAFVPLAALGAACVQDLECIDGRCETGDMCPGHCVARAAESEACARPSDCVAGLGCVGGMCAPTRPAGESCERRTDCQFPLTCRLDGTCGEPPTEGESCATSLGGDLCGGDWVCASAGSSPLCARGGAPGEACTRETPCAPGGRCAEEICIATAAAGAACVVNGCIALHACVDGTCQPLPIAGQACTVTMPCVQGECVDGTCALLAPDETCDAANEPHFGSCEGRCVSGVCATPRADGERCNRSADCAEGLECREGTSAPTCRPACG